jgi:hypothetical protein
VCVQVSVGLGEGVRVRVAVVVKVEVGKVPVGEAVNVAVSAGGGGVVGGGAAGEEDFLQARGRMDRQTIAVPTMTRFMEAS